MNIQNMFYTLMLEMKQCMHECQEPELFDLDSKLISSVDPIQK
jgi:hypothetical protein